MRTAIYLWAALAAGGMVGCDRSVKAPEAPAARSEGSETTPGSAPAGEARQGGDTGPSAEKKTEGGSAPEAPAAKSGEKPGWFDRLTSAVRRRLSVWTGGWIRPPMETPESQAQTKKEVTETQKKNQELMKQIEDQSKKQMEMIQLQNQMMLQQMQMMRQQQQALQNTLQTQQQTRQALDAANQARQQQQNNR